MHIGICSGLGCRRDGAELFRQGDARRADGGSAVSLMQHLMQPRRPAGLGIDMMSWARWPLAAMRRPVAPSVAAFS
jgi:hypothetical protein